MTKKILALPGDGVGPEVISAAVTVLEAVNSDIEIIYGDIGMTAHRKTDQYLPAETIDLATESDSILAGPVTANTRDKSFHDPIRVLKKQLDLYAVVRKFFPLCDRMGGRGVDLILLTGTPDSLLNIMESENLDGVTTEKYMSSNSCRKLFSKTIQIGELKNRKKATCTHRVSVFPVSDGMFLDMFYKEFAGSEFLINDMEVERLASEYIRDPTAFDIVVSTDLYGATIAGMVAGMVGGSRLTPVGSVGDTVGLFEPMRDPVMANAPEGYVNPTSAILSGAMALDQCRMSLDAERVRRAVRTAYKDNRVTPDVGGKAGSKEFAEYVADILEKD